MSFEDQILPLDPRPRELCLDHLPRTPKIFARALMLAPFRGRSPKAGKPVPAGRIVLNGLHPDPETLAGYRKVCGFDTDSQAPLPPTYLQTLFVGLLGKYIVSPLFPITPLGLIQTGQSLRQTRPVMPDEILDLSCSLLDMTQKEKGLETRFLLEITIQGELVWQGISTYFTRNGGGGKGKKAPAEDPILSPRQIFKVPGNTGRRYAKASGDMNPHHLYAFTAKFFGFKQPIAHGMWSLGRALAGITREMNPAFPITVEAGLKLPVFMPATLALGWDEIPEVEGEESDLRRLNFEIRDRHSHLPHLKGQCSFT